MTDTNQKLREALLSDMDIAVLRMPLDLAFGDHLAQFQYHSRVQSLLDRIEALALPTAAPDMPLSMNQFGRLVELTREHLTDNTFVYKATSKAGDTCHFGVESAAKAWAKGGTVEAIKVRDFKLHTTAPTAAPDTATGKDCLQVAAPVGEREAFEAWLGITPCGAAHDFGWAAWKARAALQSGADAVDAERYRLVRRGQHWSAVNGIGDHLRGEVLDARIDAAIRARGKGE